MVLTICGESAEFSEHPPLNRRVMRELARLSRGKLPHPGINAPEDTSKACVAASAGGCRANARPAKYCHRNRK